MTETVDTVGCPIPTTAGCTSVVNVAQFAPYASVCVTAFCSPNIYSFTLNATDPCWTQGTCDAPRRFLAALAQVFPSGECREPSTLTDTTVTFSTPDEENFNRFKFIVGCSCAG